MKWSSIEKFNSYYESSAALMDILQNANQIHVLVDLPPLIDENQACLATHANSVPYHGSLGVLAMIYDGRSAEHLSEPITVVLSFMELFNSE